MYGLVVRFTLRHGAGAEFDQLVRDTLTGIQETEPGTLLYLCHEVENDPDARIFYELYESEDAFHTHERGGHVVTFLREREALLQAPPRVEFLRTGQGKGWPSAEGRH